MALHQPSLARMPAVRQDSLRILLIVIAALVVMAAATAVLGWHGAAPSFDILPDPVGPLPF